MDWIITRPADPTSDAESRSDLCRGGQERRQRRRPRAPPRASRADRPGAGARARIVATERLVPQVSSRPDAYTLRVGVFDAEYALFPVESTLLSATAERPRVVALLERGEFGVVAIRGPFALAGRGHSTADNPVAIGRLTAP